jgi:hypothetical protein
VFAGRRRAAHYLRLIMESKERSEDRPLVNLAECRAGRLVPPSRVSSVLDRRFGVITARQTSLIACEFIVAPPMIWLVGRMVRRASKSIAAGR